MAAAGASFVARWTALHVRQMTAAFRRMMEVKGFAFMEVLSPCPPTFGEFNGFPDALDMMNYFKAKSVVDHSADLSRIGVTARPDDEVVVGNFVDRRRPSYQELLEDLRARVGKQKGAER